MNFFKKHKKGLIILGVIAAIIIALVIWIKSAYKKGMELITNAMSTETAVASRRDLVSVVSATGKITSLESRDVTSKAQGAKINTVNVSVGDMVSEGDILVLLDSSDYEVSLQSAKDSLENAEKSSNLSINSAQRRLNEASTSANLAVAKMDEQVEKATKDAEDYKQLKEQAEKNYAAWTAQAAIEEAEYKAALEAISTAQANLKEAEKLRADVSGGDPTDAEAAVEAAKVALETANKADLVALSRDVDNAKANANKWLADVSSHTASLKQAEATLESVKKSRDDTIRTNESTIASSKDSVTSAKLSSQNSTASMEKQIDTYEDQIEACTVTAPISGMVTSVNAVEGTSYTGMSLVTIEDTSSFEITTEIDEYDIGKIKPGQKVVFKTNGTGEEELEGVIKTVAPRATSSMAGMSSGGVTYTVVISVLSKNDMLRLDMTAKISIVLESGENVITVPIDAIQTDEEDGREFVNVYDGGVDANGAKTTKKVYVEVGIKTSYYAQILGDAIKEGDEVEVKREASSVFDLSQFMIEPTSGM